MKRRSLGWLRFGGLLLLGSCVFMPATSTVIAPTTAAQFWDAVLIDIEGWTNWLPLFGI